MSFLDSDFFLVFYICNQKVKSIIVTEVTNSVTFDQNVKNAISAEFEILAASLPN